MIDLGDISVEASLMLGYAVNVAMALLIALFALWISGAVRRRIIAISAKYKHLDDTLFHFLGSLARYGILTVAIIFILGRFGIQTTSLVALLGAAGLAIGLALQGTLSHLAAGVMLILFRPFKLGDFITAGGNSGTVKAITLFTTELATGDNVQIIVPNGNIWSQPITNFSVYQTRRIEAVFGVSYGSDLDAAEKVIRDVIAADERFLTDPEPFVKVTALNASSVDFMVRVWCASGDFFGLKADLHRRVKEAFDGAGIDIPFPTTTIVQAKG